MYVETFKCDACNETKKEVNDWFILVKAIDNFIVFKWSQSMAVDHGNNPTYMHFCSAECGLKLAGRLIEKMQGVTKESTPADEKAVEKAAKKFEKALDNLMN